MKLGGGTTELGKQRKKGEKGEERAKEGEKRGNAEEGEKEKLKSRDTK